MRIVERKVPVGTTVYYIEEGGRYYHSGFLLKTQATECMQALANCNTGRKPIPFWTMFEWNFHPTPPLRIARERGQ